MAHKRTSMPLEFATGESLTADLVAIGMRFATKPSPKEPNIEDSLVAASIEGIVQDDYRVLSLLVDWFEVHFERVNADRLIKLVQSLKEKRVRAFWAALAQSKKQDWRFKRHQKLYAGPRLDLIETGTEFQIRKNGEDERFAQTVLRVPNKLLRHRLEDILSPSELANRNRSYHYRVLIGPSYRADMWAAIERNPVLTPTEIARFTYGSFPTAWEVKRDWVILHNKAQLSIVS